MTVLETEPYIDPSVASFPVTSPYAAARYAVHSNKYVLLEGYLEENNWLVHTETVYNLFQSKKTWRITLFSSFQPRYFCIMEFTSNGKWIVENNCHQNGK